jgi:hypothetical protein
MSAASGEKRIIEELIERLESFCLAVNPHSEIESEMDTYESIRRDHGQNIAEAWRKARLTVAKYKDSSKQ